MIRHTVIVLMAAVILTLAACGVVMENEGSETRGEHGERTGEKSGGSGEHSGSDGESERSESSESGEEDATQYGLGDTFDQYRAGSRLIVSYDPSANAFVGTVENTTEDTLKRVRVEIHLSNGVELGPTPSVDLAPGEIADVRLDATTQPFDTWSAHAEVGGGEGGGEHGSEGENSDGSGEHGGGKEGSGEHGRRGN